MTICTFDETYKAYRDRRKVENIALSQRLKGYPVFVSKTAPYKGKDGDTYIRTATYKNGEAVNVKSWKVK